MTALNPKSGIKTTTEEICKTDYKGKQIIPKKITDTYKHLHSAIFSYLHQQSRK